MTEADWKSCRDPEKMLLFLQSSGRASERKLRLFACAACRRLWSRLTEPHSRYAVEVGERFADGFVESGELTTAHFAARNIANGAIFSPFSRHIDPAAALAASFAAFTGPGMVYGAVSNGVLSAGNQAHRRGKSREPAWTAEQVAESGLLRDIFGNPFRPVTFDPAWRTPTVLDLAQRAYEDRHLPDGTLDLPLLAGLSDALEQVGCADRELLGHLRQEGTVHVRGCWVVDLVTGRE